MDEKREKEKLHEDIARMKALLHEEENVVDVSDDEFSDVDQREGYKISLDLSSFRRLNLFGPDAKHGRI